MSAQELRVRGSYLHHKEVKAAQGIKIAAQNLENAVAGTQMLVVQKGDSVEDLKEEVMGDMTDIFKSVDKSGMPSHFKPFAQFFLDLQAIFLGNHCLGLSLFLQGFERVISCQL